MVELVTVMVVIGILGSVAAARFFQRQAFDAAAYTDQGRALVRYGQKVAIAQNRPVHVRLDGSSIALCFDEGCAHRVTAPGGNNSAASTTLANCGGSDTWACEGLPNGLSYAVTPSNPGTFYFDAMGEPFMPADIQPTLASSFSNLRLRISYDGVNHDINVAAVTGYVN